MNSSCLCDASSSVIFMFEFLEESQSFPGQNGFIFGGTWFGVALINHACFHKISSNFPSRKYENPNKISLAPDPITYTEFEAKRVYSFQNLKWTYCMNVLYLLSSNRKFYSKYGAKKYHWKSTQSVNLTGKSDFLPDRIFNQKTYRFLSYLVKFAD